MKYIEYCRKWVKEHRPHLTPWRRNLIICLLAAAVVFGCYYMKPGSMDASTVERAIVHTFSADSYTFKSRSTINLSQGERVFAVLSGEKSGDNRHVKGSVLGTPLNIYYVDGQLYQQDAVDGDWLKISGDWSNVSMLLAETDPQTNFSFKQLGEVTVLGRDHVEGLRTIKVSCSPQLTDDWIVEYFSDITYTLWITDSSNYLVKAEITATLREDPGSSLKIENYFADFNDKIVIKAPI